MFDEGLIKINGKDYVTLYGICIAIGIIFCIWTLHILGKRLKVEKKFIDNVETIGYVAIIIGFVFAALFQGFYNYLDDGKFTFNSITFLGGLIGGVGAFLAVYFIFRKKLTGSIIEILPIAPACITIAHAFGRVGCFFAGCCGGKETTSWLGIRFPGDDFKTLPTQLFEAVFLFILFGVMFYLTYKKHFKYSFVIYLGGYGVWRFALEFLRGDDRGSFIGNLSPSQFWSLIMILLAAPMYFILKFLYKERDKALEIKKDNI